LPTLTTSNKVTQKENNSSLTGMKSANKYAGELSKTAKQHPSSSKFTVTIFFQLN